MVDSQAIEFAISSDIKAYGYSPKFYKIAKRL